MIGRAVGNYRILSLIGTGGMGTVYLAEHPYMGRRVAVKILRREHVSQKDVLQRFLNEARTASTIKHPNVIEMLDTGTLDDGTPYLIMEYLDGETLGGRLRRVGRLSPPEAVDVAGQIAAALAAAHARGIVHRDLKPDNIFLVREAHTLPGRPRVKVLDFGVAKVLQAPNVVQTATGTLIGTPMYMSPEQCRGVREVDGRSDIYMLGAILYEMLCGAPPFVSEGFGELVVLHLHEPPVPPRQRSPEIPMVLESVVLRALAKEPEARFQECGELQAALAECQSAIAAQGNYRTSITPPEGAELLSAELMAKSTASTFVSPVGAQDHVDQRFVATMRLLNGRRSLFIAGGVAGGVILALIALLLLPSGAQRSAEPRQPGDEAPRPLQSPVPAAAMARSGLTDSGLTAGTRDRTPDGAAPSFGGQDGAGGARPAVRIPADHKSRLRQPSQGRAPEEEPYKL